MKCFWILAFVFLHYDSAKPYKTNTKVQVNSALNKHHKRFRIARPRPGTTKLHALNPRTQIGRVRTLLSRSHAQNSRTQLARVARVRTLIARAKAAKLAAKKHSLLTKTQTTLAKSHVAPVRKCKIPLSHPLASKLKNKLCIGGKEKIGDKRNGLLYPSQFDEAMEFNSANAARRSGLFRNRESSMLPPQFGAPVANGFNNREMDSPFNFVDNDEERSNSYTAGFPSNAPSPFLFNNLAPSLEVHLPFQKDATQLPNGEYSPSTRNTLPFPVPEPRFAQDTIEAPMRPRPYQSTVSLPPDSDEAPPGLPSASLFPLYNGPGRDESFIPNAALPSSPQGVSRTSVPNVMDSAMSNMATDASSIVPNIVPNSVVPNMPDIAPNMVPPAQVGPVFPNIAPAIEPDSPPNDVAPFMDRGIVPDMSGVSYFQNRGPSIANPLPEKGIQVMPRTLVSPFFQSAGISTPLSFPKHQHRRQHYHSYKTPASARAMLHARDLTRRARMRSRRKYATRRNQMSRYGHQQQIQLRQGIDKDFDYVNNVIRGVAQEESMYANSPASLHNMMHAEDQSPLQSFSRHYPGTHHKKKSKVESNYGFQGDMFGNSNFNINPYRPPSNRQRVPFSDVADESNAARSYETENGFEMQDVPKRNFFNDERGSTYSPKEFGMFTPKDFDTPSTRSIEGRGYFNEPKEELYAPREAGVRRNPFGDIDENGYSQGDSASAVPYNMQNEEMYTPQRQSAISKTMYGGFTTPRNNHFASKRRRRRKKKKNYVDKSIRNEFSYEQNLIQQANAQDMFSRTAPHTRGFGPNLNMIGGTQKMSYRNDMEKH